MQYRQSAHETMIDHILTNAGTLIPCDRVVYIEADYLNVLSDAPFKMQGIIDVCSWHKISNQVLQVIWEVKAHTGKPSYNALMAQLMKYQAGRKDIILAVMFDYHTSIADRLQAQGIKVFYYEQSNGATTTAKPGRSQR